MAPRIRQLYGLLRLSSRAQLVLTFVLLVFERLFLAAGAFGFARGSSLGWAASSLLIAVFGLRTLIRQNVAFETRRRLTTMIAEAALESAGDPSFLAGPDANAAVFEGRYAAEQILVRHLPSLAAEACSLLVLFFVVRPTEGLVLTSLAALAATGLVFLWLRPSTTALQRRAWGHYMAVAERTLTSIRAAGEIVASGHEDAFLEQLRASIDEWTSTTARAERRAALLQRLPFAAILLVTAGVLAQRHAFEWNGVLRLAVFLPPLAGLARTIFELVRSGPKVTVLEPCFASLARRRDERPGRCAPSSAEIRFDGVSFAFGQTPVFENLSFVWRPGGPIGIRGPNGSGKSTLLRLALGILEPTAGKITIGDVDTREVDLRSWRKTVSYLPQRPYVPDGVTVYETMRLTLPHLTPDDARAALALTGAWEQLERASDGKGRPLDVPMSSLSVGARQRVLLARAFALPAQLTILDEPDENLDAPMRSTLSVIVRRLSATRMIVVATHDEALLATTTESIDLFAQPPPPPASDMFV